MDLSYLSRKLPREQGALQVKAGSMIKSIDASIESVRRIIMDFATRTARSSGTRARHRMAGRGVQQANGHRVQHGHLPPGNISGSCELHYNIPHLQEALTNIARHAQAAMVEISLSVQDAHLTLRIHDNGIGITKNQIDNPRSFGLMGMRERSLFCNGTFSCIHRRNRRDNRHLLRIPLSEARKIDDTGTGD